MDRARTRGHPVALAAVGSMVRRPGGAPHAVLLSGPGGVGKATLALDLAAGLLCTDEDPSERPCGACRGCRMVAGGGHPDLHRLGPDGPGAQIVIGGRDAKARGVRDLADDLALMPLEGGARVAIIDAAHRMNDDAQGALLKTLEEPPFGVTIILCADDEDRLLPTVRSRCARIRLGAVPPRDVEAILLEHGIEDVPLAGRLARISTGRPGVALAYARSPDAVRARGELVRQLVDLIVAPPAARLAAMRTATPTAIALIEALDAGAAVPTGTPAGTGSTSPVSPSRGRARPASAPRPATAVAADAPDEGRAPDEDGAEEAGVKAVPAARRRRAAEALIAIWVDVTRDLALLAADERRSVRDPDLLDELAPAAAALPAEAPSAFLARLTRAAELLDSNVSPELVLDSLALAWPRHRAA